MGQPVARDAARSSISRCWPQQPQGMPQTAAADDAARRPTRRPGRSADADASRRAATRRRLAGQDDDRAGARSPVSKECPGQMPQGQMMQGQMPHAGPADARPAAQRRVRAGDRRCRRRSSPAMAPAMIPGRSGDDAAGHIRSRAMPAAADPHAADRGGGPNKTMLLQPTEGVVSIARSGGAVQPVQAGHTARSSKAHRRCTGSCAR